MTPDELDQQAETLELINKEVADRLVRQSDSSAKIDTKATTLAGFVVVAASFLATQHPQPVLAALAYAAYAAAAGCAVLAFAVGSYREVPEPRALLNGYARRSRAQTLAALAAERVRSFEENAAKHRRKALRWWLSVAALLMGVTFMVTSIVVHNGNHVGTVRSQPRVSATAVTRPGSG